MSGSNFPGAEVALLLATHGGRFADRRSRLLEVSLEEVLETKKKEELEEVLGTKKKKKKKNLGARGICSRNRAK